MSQGYIVSEPSLFAFRKPLRTSGLYALLDATAFESLCPALQYAALEYESLFSKDDAVLLENEAPYLVFLDPEKSAQWKPILRAAKRKSSGLVLASKADLKKLRLHWKKWLSVTLPEQEKPVLFRFYDPRILFAFIATLSATEAGAFFGPVFDIAGYKNETVTVLTQTEENRSVAPKAVAAGGLLYAITPAQMTAMEDVAGAEFKAKLKRYLPIVWWQYAEDLSEEELDEIIALGIDDAARLGADSESDIINMVMIRLIDPKLSTDGFYWDQAIEHSPVIPAGRTIFLLSVMFADNFSQSSRSEDLFFYKLNVFGRAEDKWPDIRRDLE